MKDDLEDVWFGGCPTRWSRRGWYSAKRDDAALFCARLYPPPDAPPICFSVAVLAPEQGIVKRLIRHCSKASRGL
ncbi:MAG: hypothetical protein GVY22_05785 [Gammaproteobacteria bacterium]|jgi:hypothetical protein|nr:hypothetical protein [Gammaproteobacteria bacterium]